MTHASRDTTTGLMFEDKVRVESIGQNISKKKLCKFLRDNGLKDVTEYLSWNFEPDEAYYLPDTNEVIIYEKNSNRPAARLTKSSLRVFGRSANTKTLSLQQV